MKYYVVSDVHSFYTELEAALKEKGFFECKEPHKLIICGDLFDRGPQSVEMQDFIVELLKKNEVILVRGNHEDLMIELLNDAEYCFETDIKFSHHWHNGTVRTLYDLTGMNIKKNTPNDMVSKMRNMPYCKMILPAMVDYYETANYIFVHGWIPSLYIISYGLKYYSTYPHWRNATKKQWKSARWINGMEAFSRGIKEDGKTIVCGHWHCSWGHHFLEGQGGEFGKDCNFEPFYDEGIIAIDACTAISKKVNCIVLDDEPVNSLEKCVEKNKHE